MSVGWYEVWVDEGKTMPYLLLLLPQQGSQAGVIVVDPNENYRIVHQAANYESAKLWLLEDEYTQVDGRMEC